MTDGRRTAGQAGEFSRRSGPGWLIPALILVIYTAAVYAPSLTGGLLRGDDLRFVAYVRNHSPLAAFGGGSYAEIPFAQVFYRPLFTLQMWTFYKLFGLHYAGYQAIILAIHIGSVVLLYLALSRIGGNRGAALLAALFYASQPYVRHTVLWVSDAMVITRLVTAAVILILAAHPRKPRGISPLLAGLLVFAPFTRENGLAILGAVIVYAAGSYLLDRSSARRDAALAITAIASTATYFLMRYLALGAWVKVIHQDMAIGLTTYSRAAIAGFSTAQRLGMYAYTMFANLTGVFFPIFLSHGALRPDIILAIAATGVPFLAVTLTWHRWPQNARRALIAGAAILLGGALLVFLIRVPRPFGALVHLFVTYSPHTRRVLHGLVSLGVLVGLIGWRRWPERAQALGLLGAGLIAANTVLAFAYFRERSLSLGIMGWGVLFVLALRGTRGPGRFAALRTAMMALLSVVIVLNGFLLFKGLPPPHMRPAEFDNTSELCNSRLPEDLVLEVARTYQLDLDVVRACIEP
jgi:hypothetical protein